MPRPPSPLPPEIIDGVAEVSMAMSMYGQPCVLTSEYRKDGAPLVAGDLPRLIEVWRTDVLPFLKEVASDELKFLVIECYSLSDPLLASVALVLPPTTGVQLGAAAAGGVAVVIRKHTPLKGRSGSGRWFVPGAPEVDTALGRILDVNPVLARWQQLAAQLLTGLADGIGTHWIPVVLSRRAPTVPNVFKRATDLDGSVLTFNLKSQRRRNVKGPG